MFYEKQILPIDENGNFLLAIHYPRYKYGGETTRESSRAYFAVGNINNPENLKDITAQCLIERPPNDCEKNEKLNTSEVQKELGRDEEAWLYSYQASLAEKHCHYVPRVVFCSLTGKLVLGTEMNIDDWTYRGELKVLDVLSNSIEHRQTSENYPDANVYAYPRSFSLNGQLLVTFMAPNNPSLAYFSAKIDNLADGKPLSGIDLDCHVTATQKGWIVADDQAVYLLPYHDSKPQFRHKLPRGILRWTITASTNGYEVGFSGDRGLICLINMDTGKVRKYYPHRGCRNDDLTKFKLSENNEWMVSKTSTNSELVVTNLKSGESWPIFELYDQKVIEHQEGKFRSISVIPSAFNFIGNKLLVSDDNTIKPIEYKNQSQVFISEQGKPGAREPLIVPKRLTFDVAIKAARLENIKSQLSKHHSPAIRLKTKKHKKSLWSMPGKRGSVDIGVSRFGGWPDLPVDVKWPQLNSKPMSFIAQLNLSELHAFQSSLDLPKKGLLLFFMGCSDEVFESQVMNKPAYMIDLMLDLNKKSKDNCKVIFIKDDVELRRVVLEGSILPELFAPCLLRFSKSNAGFPNEKSAAYTQLKLCGESIDNYAELLAALEEEMSENQLMGYPSLLQSYSPEIFITLAKHGKDPFKEPEEGSQAHKELYREASDYGLLLQLASDENPGYCWGDGGRLYFYTHREKARNGDFSDSWLYFES